MDEQEGKLAVEQLREAERKKSEAVRRVWTWDQVCQQREKHACDQLAGCSIYSTIHHY